MQEGASPKFKFEIRSTKSEAISKLKAQMTETLSPAAGSF